MKRVLATVSLVVWCAANDGRADEPACRDIFPDTWVATDALGRTMPDHTVVGPVKQDQRRVVGIFYIAWHTDSLAGMKKPYAADVTKVLAGDPNARLDAKHPLWTESSYHWGEPEAGYFLSKDEYVIRKDMSMLADAGVDVLVMDVTNAVRYWDEWDVIFPVMQKMKAEGNKVPQFCFWAFNGPSISVVQDLYEKIYQTDKYKDLWFYWDDKPLLLYNGTPSVDANGQVVQHPNPHFDPSATTDTSHLHYGDPAYVEQFYTDYTPEVKEFFTLRTMWWGYYEWAGQRFIGTEDNWSFGYDMGDERVKAMKPDDLVSTHQGTKEEAAVTPGQHPSSLTGKSWTREHGEPALNEFDLPVPTYVPWLDKTVEHPEGYGIYFQQRWDEALQANPQFLYINDWNEWTAGKYQPGQESTFPFMRRSSSYFFVDQYNAEFNRCVQPMKDGYTDNYYMQMAQNIRRYRGVRPIPELSGTHGVTVDGKFTDWENVTVEYRDTIGDTFHRDYPGYGGLHYSNNSGRNDLVASKVAVDNDQIYFLVETHESLTSHTDNHWMLLLIDADQNHETGWYGYDFLINKRVIDDRTTTLMQFDSSVPENPWIEQAQLPFRYSGTRLELAIPRTVTGLTGDALSFDFHWCDNPTDLTSPISLCVNGDSAPNRRFNYRCIWKR
ncbi:MAG: glycoside hydrolase family 71/99 protein [Pirellulaceae bacterium]